MEARKNGIPAHDTRYVAKKNWNVLRYDFVSDDGLVPSSCEIRLGDPDPMTGEPITDMTVFSSYYRLVNQEVRTNLDQIRIEKTKKERRKTNELKARLAADFEKEYGYAPNEDNLRHLAEEVEGSPYILVPIDAIVNEEDDSSGVQDWTAYSVPFDDPYEDDESLEIRAMREVGRSLTGRMKVLFDLMYEKFDAGAEKVKRVDLADELGVSPAAITKALAKIAALINAKTAELAAE